MPELGRNKRRNENIKAIKNAEAKFRVEIVSKAESVAEATD